VALPLALLAAALARVDLAAGARRLASAGPLALLALVPAGLVLAADALGWRRLLSPVRRRRVGLPRLFAARLCGEAVAQTLPSAGLAGEAASAWYLSRHAELTLGESIGSLAARRVRVAQGHGAVLLLAAAVGLNAPAVPGRFVALAAVAAALLLGTAGLGSLLLLSGAPFVRVREGLRQLPWEAARAWAGARFASLGVAQREASRSFVGPWRARAAASFCYALVFLVEVVDTWLLLRLVGAEVSFAQALAVEPLVSLLRAFAFFAPAGLGVQDLGYVTLFQAVGVPQLAAVGAGFVLLKRLRELVWTGLGWSVLVAAEARARPKDEGPNTQLEEEASSEAGAAEDPVRLRVAQPDHADASDRARVA